jgi:hypothetical protein
MLIKEEKARTKKNVVKKKKAVKKAALAKHNARLDDLLALVAELEVHNAMLQAELEAQRRAEVEAQLGGGAGGGVAGTGSGVAGGAFGLGVGGGGGAAPSSPSTQAVGGGSGGGGSGGAVGGRRMTSCSFGCGAHIPTGVASVLHFAQCTVFKAHPAFDGAIERVSFSTRDAAVAHARKCASGAGLSSRGPRWICSCSLDASHPPSSDPTSSEFDPAFFTRPAADSGTAYVKRRVERGVWAGHRLSQKAVVCDAAVYVTSKNEVVIFKYHSHPDMGVRGAYDTALRGRVEAVLEGSPHLSPAEVAALLRLQLPTGVSGPSDDAVRAAVDRFRANERPPKDRPCSLQLLDIVEAARNLGAVCHVKLPDASIIPPPTLRPSKPAVISHGWQLSQQFYAKYGGAALGEGAVVAVVSDTVGLTTLSSAKAVCVDKVWKLGADPHLNFTLVVAFRANYVESAEPGTCGILDSAVRLLEERQRSGVACDPDAARALIAASVAAKADLVVGQVPVLVAIIIATRGDAATTYCGLHRLRALALEETKRDELAVLALLQDADSGDALAAAAAFPSLLWVFRCVWHLITSAIRKLGPTAAKGRPTAVAPDAAVAVVALPPPEEDPTRFTKADALQALDGVLTTASHVGAKKARGADGATLPAASFAEQCALSLALQTVYRWRCFTAGAVLLSQASYCTPFPAPPPTRTPPHPSQTSRC